MTKSYIMPKQFSKKPWYYVSKEEWFIIAVALNVIVLSVINISQRGFEVGLIIFSLMMIAYLMISGKRIVIHKPFLCLITVILSWVAIRIIDSDFLEVFLEVFGIDFPYRNRTSSLFGDIYELILALSPYAFFLFMILLPFSFGKFKKLRMVISCFMIILIVFFLKRLLFKLGAIIHNGQCDKECWFALGGIYYNLVNLCIISLILFFIYFLSKGKE